MEILLFRRFKNETASNISNEVFNTVSEDQNLIAEWKETKILPKFPTEYEIYKTSVTGIISRFNL